MSRRHRHLTSLLTAAFVLAGCGGTPDDAPDDADGPSGELLVFAAASLTDAFDDIADAFVATHPAVEVALNLAGSQTLASQIEEGAPADVFASANAAQMSAVADGAGIAGEPEPFAANLLAIAVEPGNPLGIEELADLADPDLVLVLPAEEVPAGQYGRQALNAAGITVTPSSLEHDVRAALAKIALGEADASIVYASDIAAGGDRVDGVDIPVEANVPATYPIAVVAGAPNPDAADAFVDFVLGEHGQRVLAAHGFSAP